MKYVPKNKTEIHGRPLNFGRLIVITIHNSHEGKNKNFEYLL